MKRASILCLLIIGSLLISCGKTSSINGLWSVKLVRVGGEEMTPNARWIRFNDNSTQQSGNGWFQHSYGTWQLDSGTNELAIHDINGIKDQYGSYKIRFEDHRMYWTRLEDGQNLEVVLERISNIPETYGDRLLGLWQLEEAIGNGMYFDQSYTPEMNGYLFLRWDKRFSMGTPGGRINGVYNVHGHRPELELIPYGDSKGRNFWRVSFGENKISLTLLNSDSLISRKFNRTYEFPE